MYNHRQGRVQRLHVIPSWSWRGRGGRLSHCPISHPPQTLGRMSAYRPGRKGGREGGREGGGREGGREGGGEGGREGGKRGRERGIIIEEGRGRREKVLDNRLVLSPSSPSPSSPSPSSPSPSSLLPLPLLTWCPFLSSSTHILGTWISARAMCS